MIITFTRENHGASLRKLNKLKNKFVQARIYTATGNIDITTSSFDYLSDYCHAYTNFILDVTVD